MGAWWRVVRGQSDDPASAIPVAGIIEKRGVLIGHDGGDSLTARRLRGMGFRPGSGPPIVAAPAPAIWIDEGSDPDEPLAEYKVTRIPFEPAPVDQLEIPEALTGQALEMWLYEQTREWQAAKLRELGVSGRSKLNSEAKRVDALVVALTA
jgi:hypothetical protein